MTTSRLQNFAPGVGLLTLVGASVPLVAAATSMTVNGLNLDADKAYILRWVAGNASASIGDLKLFYNGDTTEANYYFVYLNATGSAGSGRFNLASMSATTVGEPCDGWALLNRDKNGRPRAICFSNRGAPSDVGFYTFAHVKTAVTSVTSITIAHANASGLPIGSYFEVYKVGGTGGGTVLASITPNTVPLASAFTLTGSGVTATDKTGRLQLRLSTFNTTFRGLMQSAPATPYTIDARIQIAGVASAGSTIMGGLALSNGTAYRTFHMALTGGAGGPRVFAWNSNAATSSTPMSSNYGAPIWPDAWLRITDDGTNRRFYVSSNGLDFMLMHAEASSAGFTTTQVGLNIYCDYTSAPDFVVSVPHYRVSAGILGDAA